MFDNQTTLILAGFTCALLPLLLWWLAPFKEREPGDGWWQLGSAVGALGLILLALRLWLPVWLSNHTANTSLLIALLLWAQSLRTGLGRSWPSAWVGWACVAAFMYYSATYIFVTIDWRIPLNRVVMGCQGLYISWLAWELARRERSPNAMAMTLCYAVLGLGLYVSAWVAINTPLEFSPEGVLLKIPGSPAVLTMVTAVVGNFCYLGMMLERSTRKKQRLVQAQAVADENARLDEQLLDVDRQRRLVLAAGSLAHELNQPLTAALSRTELAQRVLDSNTHDTAAMAQILEKASLSLERTEAILARIRSASHSQAIESGLLDMRNVVQTTVELLRTELAEQDVVLQMALPEHALRCHGDAVLLSQVLVNLLRNAAQAMNNSPLKRVEINASYSGPDVVVNVQDHGPGVPQAVLQRWGEPFLGTRTEGMGLGLAICRAIMQQHGGTLTLRNAPTGGVLAEMTLPAGQEPLA